MYRLSSRSGPWYVKTENSGILIVMSLQASDILPVQGNVLPLSLPLRQVTLQSPIDADETFCQPLSPPGLAVRNAA